MRELSAVHTPWHTQLSNYEHAGDVEQWVKTRSDADLSSYRALVTVSGDGLLFEVINGLASRPQSDFNIPIGVVPAGGGNATAGAENLNPQTSAEERNTLRLVSEIYRLAFRHGCLRHSVFILSHPEPSPTDNPMENLHLINRGLIPPKPSEQHASARDSFFQQVITPLDGIVFESMDGKSRRFGILSINWGGFAELDSGAFIQLQSTTSQERMVPVVLKQLDGDWGNQQLELKTMANPVESRIKRVVDNWADELTECLKVFDPLTVVKFVGSHNIIFSTQRTGTPPVTITCPYQ
ncbi:diacylglycerol kinase catalytic domain protein [Opisthorchis viverrini]|uniref:Diacylglycerol kinase catalytic domain protein n=1 Tax=Opisthorchis viverrini TaxID=6198 RepID=A0A1S8WHR6_OPIVI|nr:diacylglycerol kinase catalytic domain protein [Opisthorchis viverrini]